MVDGERFHILGGWTTVTRKLLLREELDLRAFLMGHSHIFTLRLAYHSLLFYLHLLLPKDHHPHILQLSSHLLLQHKLTLGMLLIHRRVQMPLMRLR